MINENLVSVVMSVYNSELTIKKSIESILNQTYKDIELIIIEDGSSDNTPFICKEYENEHENVFVYSNNENIGLTKSLNIGIKKSKGKFIARQDADDFSEHHRIKTQIEIMTSDNLDAVSSRARVINSKQVIPNFSYYLPLRYLVKIKNPFIHGTLFIKRNIIDEAGLYNEKFYYSQDYKLMYDLVSRKHKIKIIKEPLYYLNMTNNISNVNSQEQKYYADCVKKNIEPK